ncbi:MAG: thioredoxin family protein [Candidatus Aphodocola sp.]
MVGSNCSNGIKLRKMVERAVESYDGSIEIELEEKNNKIKNIPALIINDNVISEGKVLSAKEIIRVIKTEAVC